MDGRFLRDAAGSAGSASPLSNRERRRYPRAARLLRRAEFDAVYRDGRRRAARQFAVFFRPNGLERSRFGVSLKRALGGAVVRNRLRRRVREILRLHRTEIPTGWDIVIHPRSSVATAEFRSLEAELLDLLCRISPDAPKES